MSTELSGSPEIFNVTLLAPAPISVTLIERPVLRATLVQGLRGPAGEDGVAGAQGDPGATGAAGPPIVETGSYASPGTITGAITVPSDQRAKRYVQGAAALTAVTSIGNGTGTQELYLFGVSDASQIQIPATSLSNVLLSGEWRSKLGAMICLHWTQGLNKWVEAYRNEI